MRNCGIWCIAILAMGWTAYGEQANTAEKGKSAQESRDGGTTAELPPRIAVNLGGGVKLELLLIPAGSFIMGDDQSGLDWEKPAHKVTISKPFYLGKYEVTQRQWEAVMGGNPSRFKFPKNPVETVSWDDCQAFIDKLNARTVGQGGKFALPTEAQWEYACRAGSTTKYCFGDDESQLGVYAWYEGNSGAAPHPVGQRKPNAWGLSDMHGNVWEWCEDWYHSGYYGKSPAKDPKGPVVGSHHVDRGGGWLGSAARCRSVDRSVYTPGYWDGTSGLRLARILTE